MQYLHMLLLSTPNHNVRLVKWNTFSLTWYLCILKLSDWYVHWLWNVIDAIGLVYKCFHTFLKFAWAKTVDGVEMTPGVAWGVVHALLPHIFFFFSRYLLELWFVEIWMWPQELLELMVWTALLWMVSIEMLYFILHNDLHMRSRCLSNLLLTGDQVSKKGGMTGGFYDHRRSKLKFMNIIMQNTKSINIKEEELEKVRFMLQDILF